MSIVKWIGFSIGIGAICLVSAAVAEALAYLAFGWEISTDEEIIRWAMGAATGAAFASVDRL